MERIGGNENCERCGGRGLIGGPHHATMRDCPDCGPCFAATDTEGPE